MYDITRNHYRLFGFDLSNTVVQYMCAEDNHTYILYNTLSSALLAKEEE
jgi:hypothetical protein